MKRLSETVEARTNQLASCPLFSALSERQLREVTDIAAPRRYAAGEIIFLEGDAAGGFCVLVDGRAKIYRTGDDGREQVLHIFGPGEPCGEAAVFEGGSYPATMAALGEVTLLHIGRAEFLKLGRAMPEILLGMLAVLSRRLRHFVNLVDDLSLKEVSARLGQYLAEHARETSSGDSVVNLDVSKSLLASQLGTIPETLSRTLRRMQEDGLLRVEGKRIFLLNPEALRNA